MGEKAAVIIAEDLGIKGVTAFWTWWKLLREINESTCTITWTSFSHPASLSCTSTSYCMYHSSWQPDALRHANVIDLRRWPPLSRLSITTTSTAQFLIENVTLGWRGTWNCRIFLSVLKTSLQYRPRTLDALHYHRGLSERLKSLVCRPFMMYCPSNSVIGFLRRLPAYALLWTFRCWQKDPYNLYSAAAIWKWCGKGESP